MIKHLLFMHPEIKIISLSPIKQKQQENKGSRTKRTSVQFFIVVILLDLYTHMYLPINSLCSRLTVAAACAKTLSSGAQFGTS